MKFLLSILIINIAVSCSAQALPDTMKVLHFPVREGKMIKMKYTSGCPRYDFSEMATIYAYQDSVFHYEDGRVQSIFNLGDCFSMIIENEKKEWIIYSNLQTVFVKKNDILHRDSPVGVLVKDAGELNFLDVIILINGKPLLDDKLFRYILDHMSDITNLLT